jgi:uncharacterized membrane protein YjgN (DUF898 family)
MTLALQSDDRLAVDAAGPRLAFLPALGERIRFTGSRSQYWRLMSRGAVLEGVTLGIYRFWLFTDQRRFLWANTEMGGESFEYRGTAVELLLGFLMAIGMLIPVYAMLFVSSLDMGALSRWSGVVAFAVLSMFGQYAAYRARRYRLTRTMWRGLRFHQSGSAIGYALRAMLWWMAVAMTLGLAYPWMEASLTASSADVLRRAAHSSSRAASCCGCLSSRRCRLRAGFCGARAPIGIASRPYCQQRRICRLSPLCCWASRPPP